MRQLLHRRIETQLDRAAARFLGDPRLPKTEFSGPVGAQALVPADSISWQVFKNPVTLFIGGVTAVILELADPKVRTGVWEHSIFTTDPVLRLKRTGFAAMVTIYAARNTAEVLISKVNRIHQRVQGETPSGAVYDARDPELLSWVQATAAFGFLQAYSTYAAPVSDQDQERYYAESQPIAELYGAMQAPASLAAQGHYFDSRLNKLEPSKIVFDFLGIMARAKIFPAPAHLGQAMLIRAAVDLVPPAIREIVGLGAEYGLRGFEKPLISLMARRADRYILRSSPAVRACRRLGLADDFLYLK